MAQQFDPFGPDAQMQDQRPTDVWAPGYQQAEMPKGYEFWKAISKISKTPRKGKRANVNLSGALAAFMTAKGDRVARENAQNRQSYLDREESGYKTRKLDLDERAIEKRDYDTHSEKMERQKENLSARETFERLKADAASDRTRYLEEGREDRFNANAQHQRELAGLRSSLSEGRQRTPAEIQSEEEARLEARKKYGVLNEGDSPKTVEDDPVYKKLVAEGLSTKDKKNAFGQLISSAGEMTPEGQRRANEYKIRMANTGPKARREGRAEPESAPVPVQAAPVAQPAKKVLRYNPLTGQLE